MKKTKQITSSKRARRRRRLNKRGKALLAFLITFAIAVTSCTISKKAKKVIKGTDNEITNQELNSKNLIDILEETDTEESILYENLQNMKIYYQSELKVDSKKYAGKTLDELEESFLKSREDGNLEDANLYLYCIINLLIEGDLTDALKIEDPDSAYFKVIKNDNGNNYLSLTEPLKKEKKYKIEDKKLNTMLDTENLELNESELDELYNKIKKIASTKTGKVLLKRIKLTKK